MYSYFFHFTGEEAEAWKGEVICSDTQLESDRARHWVPTFGLVNSLT